MINFLFYYKNDNTGVIHYHIFHNMQNVGEFIVDPMSSHTCRAGLRTFKNRLCLRRIFHGIRLFLKKKYQQVIIDTLLPKMYVFFKKFFKGDIIDLFECNGCKYLLVTL